MTLSIDGIIFSLQRQGGISVYFHQLIEHLAARGQPASVLLEEPTRQLLGEGHAGISKLRRAARWLERYRACRMPSGVSLFHSSYYRLPEDRRTPTVVTVYDFIYERYRTGAKRWVHMAQKRAAIRRAQAVICISESTRQDLLQWIGETPGQQVHVIHCGVSDLFQPLGMPRPPRPHLLYVGERGGYKNFRLLLQALAFLPDMELHCVGGGPLQSRELADLAPSVRERVRYLGYVSDEGLNEQYNLATCLVYPSSYEGFGIPVVEAMRAGCPVVCIDCKAVLEVGRDALTVAEAADSRALAVAIERTSDSMYRDQIIKAGLSVAQQYSWRATHEQTLQVYRSLGADLNARDGAA